MAALPDTQQDLIARLREIDSDTAWETFLGIYEPAIFRFAKSRGLQDADARDVTQQVLIAVHNNILDWDPDRETGSFRGWLFRVTRNLASKALREKRKRRLSTDMADHSLESEPRDDETSSVLLLEYRRGLFRWAASVVRGQFEPKTWQAFWQTGIEGQRPAQVADDLQMTVGAVYAAKCRVMTRMKEAVERLSDSDILIDSELGQ